VQGDDTEIVSGLKAGEIIVVDGADKLREGANVNVASMDGKTVGAAAGKGPGNGAQRKPGEGRRRHPNPDGSAPASAPSAAPDRKEAAPANPS
jgi:multidrug efflux system membrane fusion protein